MRQFAPRPNAKVARNKAEPKAKAVKSQKSEQAASTAKTQKPNEILSLVGTGGPDLAGPLQLDGRAGRTLQRCQAAIEKLREGLTGVDLYDKVRDVQALASKDYKAYCQQRVVKVNEALKAASVTMKAVAKSTNKAAFETQLAELEDLVALGQTMNHLISAMPLPKADPEEFLKLLEEFKSKNQIGLSLGPGFTMKSLMARANEACLHGKHDEFTSFLMTSSQEASQLSHAMGELELRAHICTEVENRMLSAMRAITTEELEHFTQKSGKADAPNLQEAISLTKAVAKACENDEFLPKDLLTDAAMVSHLLEQHDIALLQSSTGKVSALVSEKAEKVPGLLRFFLQHDVGKALLAMGCERVQEGELEGEYQGLARVAEEAVQQLATAVQDASSQGTSQGVQALVDALSPVAAALQELKGCSFLKSKQAKKPLVDGTLPGDILIGLEKRFSSNAIKLVDPDLRQTLKEHLLLGCNFVLFLVVWKFLQLSRWQFRVSSFHLS